MRSGTVLRVEFQRRIRDAYGEAYTPITPPTLGAFKRDRISPRDPLKQLCGITLLPLALLIPSTFGGLFNLFALSPACA